MMRGNDGRQQKAKNVLKRGVKIRRRRKRLRAAVVLFRAHYLFLILSDSAVFYIHRYAKRYSHWKESVSNLDVSGMTVSQVEKAVEKQGESHSEREHETIKTGKSSGDTTYKKWD